MQVTVTATPVEGAPGRYTPDTLWSAVKPVTIEVVDSDDDPPCELRTPQSPGITAFDGHKIGRRTLALLRSTPGIVISGADQTSAIEMAARGAEQADALRKQIASLEGKIAELSAEVVRLKPFESQRAEQEATIADLRARLSRPVAQPQPAKQPEARR